MKPLALPLAFFLFAIDPAFAQEGLEKLRTSFAELKQETYGPQNALNSKYENQLDVLIKRAQDAGKFELVIEIREEKSQYRDATATEAAERIKDPQLEKLRKIYDTQTAKLLQERNKALDAIYAKHLKDLSEYRDASTKDGRIEDAIQADEELKLIEAQIADAKAEAELEASADNSAHPDSADLASQIVGEWQYSENGRTWRRIFLEDGRIELWLEGHRDGHYLSEYRWSAEKRGILNGAWVFQEEDEICRLKVTNGGQGLKWGDGPAMKKVESEKHWRK